MSEIERKNPWLSQRQAQQNGSALPIPTHNAIAAGGVGNPYDGDQWGVIFIGGVQVPGTVVDIDGADKPSIWLVQHGIMQSGGFTIWRGTKIAEEIKVSSKLIDGQAFSDWLAIGRKLRPKEDAKPPAFLAENSALNFAGIINVSGRVKHPKWSQMGGYWIGEMILIEVRSPKQIKPGPPDPPRKRTKNDELADELIGLGNEIAKTG
jgi:hypothetical protein